MQNAKKNPHRIQVAHFHVEIGDQIGITESVIAFRDEAAENPEIFFRQIYLENRRLSGLTSE